VLLTEHFQAEVGGHGGHDLQRSRRKTFGFERKRAIDFGANLPANFSLARFINIRSKFLHSSLSSRQSMGSNPYAANIPFLSSLYSDEHSVRDRMVAARSGTLPYELFNAKTISICYRFFSR
jgi:hypothetical protein